MIKICTQKHVFETKFRPEWSYLWIGMDIYPIMAHLAITGQIENHQERWNVQVLSFKQVLSSFYGLYPSSFF